METSCTDFFFDEFADSTSKVLVSVRRMASLSFEVKDYDINRTYFLGTIEELVYI